MLRPIPFFLFAAFLFSACSPAPKPQAQEIKYNGNPAILDVSEELTKNPTDPELYLMRAMLFYDAELFDEAIEDTQKALSFDSSNIEVRHILADVYFDSGKEGKGMEVLEETCRIFPGSEGTLLKWAEFQFIMEDYKAALSTMDKLEQTNDKNPELHYMRGRIYGQMGQRQKAIGSYEAALSLAPDHFDSLLELGTIYSLDKRKEALPLLERAQVISPANPDIIFEIGNYYRYQGENAKALEKYKQVVMLDHQYSDAHINTGLIHLENKDAASALPFFNMAVETAPSYPSAYYYRGVAYAYLGQTEKAKKNLQQALALAPDFKDAKRALEEL